MTRYQSNKRLYRKSGFVLVCNLATGADPQPFSNFTDRVPSLNNLHHSIPFELVRKRIPLLMYVSPWFQNYQAKRR